MNETMATGGGISQFQKTVLVNLKSTIKQLLGTMSERRGISTLFALAMTTALCSSCASLAHETTRKLCAPWGDRNQPSNITNNRFVAQCILSNNATILRAEQDFADYSDRLNKLVANPALKKEYAALRARIEQSTPAKAKGLAFKKLGSLNQWLAKQEGLDLHRWHSYSPHIRQVVASKS